MKLLSSLLLLVAALLMLSGCAGVRRTTFIHPEYDFAQVERIAVVPFENLASDPGAANYATRLFITELLAKKAFDIVEPGQVTHILDSLGQPRFAELDLSKLAKIGELLGVQCVIFGSVGEVTPWRNGATSSYVVSLEARMSDCASGATVWNGAVSTSGPGMISRLFGGGENSRGKALHAAVKKAVDSLVK